MKLSVRRAASVAAVVWFAALCAPAQNIITTVAGNTWVFTGNGGPAANAPLGRIGGVITDSFGNVYASDASNNLIVKITPGGTLAVVAGSGTEGYSGDGGPATAAELSAPTAITLDTVGNIYFADEFNNVVRKVSTSGVITTVAGTGAYGYSGDGGPATAAMLSNPSGVAVDAAGNVYIADQFNYRVRKVDTGGLISTFAGVGYRSYFGDGGPATAAGLSTPFRLALDSAGNLYFSDGGNNRVRMVNTSGIITTFAGNGVSGFSGDGGPATGASLAHPVGVNVDAFNNIYISEVGNERIRRVTAGIINTIAGSGIQGFSGDGGPATAASLSVPFGGAPDLAGNLYIADTENHRVRKVDSTGTITTFAGNGMYKFGGDGGPASLALLQFPLGLRRDSAGNLYIADTDNRRVRKIAPNSTITTVAGNGVLAAATDGVAAVGTSLPSPEGLALDSAGNLYISDSRINRVRRVDTGGIISAFAGSGSRGFYGDTLPATLAWLNRPEDVLADSAGNLYIADEENNRVRKVDSAGIITTIAGNGTPAFTGDGGPATLASLNGPVGLALDAAGNLYISDSDNHAVRKVTPAGTLTTVAGNGISGFSGDGGPATAASLNFPALLVADSLGNLFIADTFNHRIRKVNRGGIISTLAGNGTPYFAGDGGPATLASLNFPVGLALDTAGNLYFSDAGNDRIRKIALNNGTVGAVATVGDITAPISLPIALTLGAGSSIDSLSFALTITPNGTAPALSGALSFTQDPALPAPSLVDAAVAPNVIAVSWLALGTPLTGTVNLGNVVLTPPVGALVGQTYTLQVNGASGSLGNTEVMLLPAPSATLTNTWSYLAGDTFPEAGDNSQQFGNSTLNNLDLILGLRAVNSVPGYRPLSCTDRYDAIDTYPADTSTSRGGDGTLDTMDLIITLRRVTNIDGLRPRRRTRGGCVAAGVAYEAMASGAPSLVTGRRGAGGLLFGRAADAGGGVTRIAVYLQAHHSLDLAGLSYSLGVPGTRVRFLAGDIGEPSVLDDAVPGVISLAWLEGVQVAAGQRLLLGFLEVSGGGVSASSIQVYGIQANERSSGRNVPLGRESGPVGRPHRPLPE